MSRITELSSHIYYIYHFINSSIGNDCAAAVWRTYPTNLQYYYLHYYYLYYYCSVEDWHMPIESSQYFIILFRVNQVFTFYHFITTVHITTILYYYYLYYHYLYYFYLYDYYLVLILLLFILLLFILPLFILLLFTWLLFSIYITTIYITTIYITTIYIIRLVRGAMFISRMI